MADEIKDDVLPQLNAKEINLVDSQGRVRITLSVDESDGDSDCQIEFKDAQGITRYTIVITDDGVVNTSITDPDGNGRTNVLSKL